MDCSENLEEKQDYATLRNLPIIHKQLLDSSTDMGQEVMKAGEQSAAALSGLWHSVQQLRVGALKASSCWFRWGLPTARWRTKRDLTVKPETLQVEC